MCTPTKKKLCTPSRTTSTMLIYSISASFSSPLLKKKLFVALLTEISLKHVVLLSCKKCSSVLDCKLFPARYKPSSVSRFWCYLFTTDMCNMMASSERSHWSEAAWWTQNENFNEHNAMLTCRLSAGIYAARVEQVFRSAWRIFMSWVYLIIV